MPDPIPEYLQRIDPDHIRRNLFHLSSDPLPFRKLNFTRPGQSRNSLYETDDFITAQLQSWEYEVETDATQVQAFACDTSKPKAHQYAKPDPDSPWYTAYNLYAEKPGARDPEEIILLLAHKDSQSWVDSPGAYDNGAGTVALMEIARVLAGVIPKRTIRFLFCNEEHAPWTSVTAAVNAKERGDNLVAIYNLDSMGGKSQADVDSGRQLNVTLYTEPEGEKFADLMTQVNTKYDIGLDQETYRRERPGDDDGSFINAGFPHAVANLGSWPYADPTYHTEEDIPDRVDIANLVMSTRATLAAVLSIDLDNTDFAI